MRCTTWGQNNEILAKIERNMEQNISSRRRFNVRTDGVVTTAVLNNLNPAFVDYAQNCS